MTLVEVDTCAANGIDEEKPAEWEEVEFLVDNGAPATVIGLDSVKAVSPSDPTPSTNYGLADGSLIRTEARGDSKETQGTSDRRG